VDETHTKKGERILIKKAFNLFFLLHSLGIGNKVYNADNFCPFLALSLALIFFPCFYESIELYFCERRQASKLKVLIRVNTMRINIFIYIFCV
jgi:hypothetical protein